jgi:gamma-glutamyltranspeptidase/glutathione hydrolase
MTLNPAMVMKDGKLFMPLACPATDMQCQAMVQMFLNMLEFGMNPQQATEAARFGTHSFPGSYWPHAYYPGLLNLEARISREVVTSLADRGHCIEMWPDWTEEAGGLCAVVIDQESGVLTGVSDPRRESAAIGR